MFYYSFFIKVHIKPRKWAVMRMCRTCPCCYHFPIRFGTSLTVWYFFFHFIISGVSLNLLSFLYFVLYDIPVKWFASCHFYALCFGIYQWNSSQIIIFMLYVLWYTSGMVRKLSFLCFAFCDIPMKMVRKILFLCVTFCFTSCDISKMVCKLLFLCFSICDIPMEWSTHYITQYPFLFNTCIQKNTYAWVHVHKDYACIPIHLVLKITTFFKEE